MHQPDANVWIHLLHPILNRTLAGLGELPTRDARTFQPAADALKIYFHDGTERPVPRPTDPAAQKEYYSGKKKWARFTRSQAGAENTFTNLTTAEAPG
jgi:hypothetical protein